MHPPITTQHPSHFFFFIFIVQILKDSSLHTYHPLIHSYTYTLSYSPTHIPSNIHLHMHPPITTQHPSHIQLYTLQYILSYRPSRTLRYGTPSHIHIPPLSYHTLSSHLHIYPLITPTLPLITPTHIPSHHTYIPSHHNATTLGLPYHTDPQGLCSAGHYRVRGGHPSRR